jgi:esterase/lipase superfamily enzyme
VRTAQLGLDLPFNGGLCCYSWPSQGGIKNYRLDEQVNAASVEPFKQFLQQLFANIPPETRLQVVVHSMGNRLVLQALAELGQQPGPIQPIDHLVLCAPDVGLRDFTAWLPTARQLSRRMTLYVGDSDTALLASKALHAEQRIGDALPPVIVPGVETIDCSAVEFSLMGHSYYGGNVEVLCDLFAVLKEDLPPEQRQWLAPRQHQGQTYWTFTARPTPVRYTWNFPEDKRVH